MRFCTRTFTRRFCSSKSLPRSTTDEAGGRVVLMTSGQHLAPMTREVAYAISKGALNTTKTLADELINRGITVNTVNPRSDRHRLGHHRSRPGYPQCLSAVGANQTTLPVHAWLCSDDARWITGQVIDSEGGFRR